MTCIAEDRFIEILDRGGLAAGLREEREHLDACEVCRESWASVAATAELLTDARPRRSSLWMRILPVAAAAAMLLTIGAVIVFRETPPAITKPPKDPVADFLNGTPEQARMARPEVLRMGRKALPGLVAARPRLQGSVRFKEVQDIIWTLKAGTLQGTADGDVVRKMETMKIDLAFEKTAVDDMLGFVRDFSSINLVLDPTVDPGIVDTFTVKDESLRSTLEILCSVKDLDFDFRFGVVFLSRPMRLWSTEPGVGLPEANAWTKQVLDSADQEIASKLRKVRVTFDMQTAPMTAAAAYVSEVSGITVKLGDRSGDPLVTLKVANVPLVHAVELLTLPRGWDARIEGHEVVIVAPAK